MAQRSWGGLVPASGVAPFQCAQLRIVQRAVRAHAPRECEGGTKASRFGHVQRQLEVEGRTWRAILPPAPGHAIPASAFAF